MASKSKIDKAKQTPKFSTRGVGVARFAAGPARVYRKFGICRICFRNWRTRG